MTNDGAKTSASKRLLLFLVLVVLLASYLASLVQTSCGRVQVLDIKIPSENGQWVSADLFKPKNATRQRPAPLVVVVPGFQRSKECLSNISLELARRGIVVIAIDPYSQGASSSSMSKRSATKEGYGLFAVIDYACNTSHLNYIDKARIGATGHSAGGNAVLQGASHFGKEAIRSGEPSKLNAVYVSGYALSCTKNVLKHVRSNLGMSYALYDEGAFRNELHNGDMRRAPEALRLVNAGRAGKAPLEEVTIGQHYGDMSDRTMRVVHNEKLLHPLQPYSFAATAHQLEYFMNVFDVDTKLPSQDQIWHWKELFTLLSSIAALVALVPLAGVVLSTHYFQPLVHPIPPPSPRLEGKGRPLFWSLLGISALVACFSYIPMCMLSQRLFATATERGQTWFFPQRMNNAVMLWAVLNGLVAMAMIGTTRHFSCKSRSCERRAWGAEAKISELLRTALLALIIFAAYFLLLFTVYYFFHVDYRFVFFGVRVFQPAMLVVLCLYAPFFFLFFLANSLRVNGPMRLEGDSEWKSMLLAGLANSLGLLLILFIQYSVLAWTGTVYWTEAWLYVNLLFAVAPIMFVLPYFHRYFFRMTGRIYLGPMITCLIFVMIMVSNTVCYTPL